MSERIISFKDWRREYGPMAYGKQGILAKQAWKYQAKRIAELEQFRSACLALTGSLWPQNETTAELERMLTAQQQEAEDEG
jgi:hypothetical protein